MNDKAAEESAAAARTGVFPESPQAESTALVDNSPVDHESRLRDLRDVNERLLIATLRAQELERQAEASQRQQLNFMAILAHELRNPVAPIRHAIKLLENEALSEEQKRWSREVIARQVEHMARLLDDLLDSARSKRGEWVLQIVPADLHSIVKDAVAAAMPLIEKKQHALEVNLPDKPITLMVDAVRMAQVLSNLLTNAAKYTDPGGRITITVKVGNDQVAMAVRDTGIGIRAESISSLFSMFSQLESTVDRAEGGLGIGLALAKELVKLHGGWIDVRSDGENRGSEFTVLLPSAIVQPGLPLTQIHRATVARTNGSRCILIADDNVDAANSLGTLLEMAGNQVLIEQDGVDALAVAREHRPQVAILDVGMPRMDGHQLAKNLRSEIWGKDMLLIALTGWGQAEDKARALASGFDHHFTKPVDSDELEALIAAYAPTSNDDKPSGDDASALTAKRASLSSLSGAPGAPPRRSEGPLGGQHNASELQVADLREANEQLVLAALQAETLAETAEHNLSELARSSQRDVLTDTPNRALMLDRLENAIAMAQRHATHVALLFVDLDNFKVINDTWGHAVGDQVLQRAARRLESAIRASDAVSRHGGDEFLVMLTEVSSRSGVAAIAAKMLMALAEPALTGAQLPPLSASIGISVYPEDGLDAAFLISRADAAMYRAKRNGRNRFEFCD